MSVAETPSPGTTPDPAQDSPEILPFIPERIGRYHLRRIIASGGMGTVYEAIQEHPRRTVALKVLRPGAISESALRRFDYESQILARLSHPGIAQVFEAGSFDDGAGAVPYFVMEYIPAAKPLTEFARSRGLGTRDSLELFVKVCDAVQHGHQKGIIHRDLKPTNILVDSAGQPKIIDFGVARATDADLAYTSVQTDVGQMVGTLRYMSPEQVEADPHDIDTRSDVYELGVVLYELLTGDLPLDLNNIPVHEAARRIREDAPPRLSGVNPAFRGDLEMIVRKALHKDRERRYRTAADLGHDIERYLEGRPIEARGDSASYIIRTKTRRAVVRHPIVATAVAMVAAALLTASLGVWLVYEWTPTNRLFQQTMTTAVSPAGGAPVPDTVRVIALTDRTDVETLAAAEGLADVSMHDLKSVRRLHGRLMSRLALAAPRVVAWDIAFSGETPFDADFVQGARALRAAGAEVVVAVPSWRLEDGLPDVSRSILPEVRWGGGTGMFDATAPWKLHLVVRRRPTDLRPSLALTTLTSYQHPNTEVSMSLDEKWGTLDVGYWRANPEYHRTRRIVGEPDRIALSEVHETGRPSPEVGLEADDVIGYHLVDLPSDETLARMTVEYGDVFAADRARLEQWFGDRIVLIAPVPLDSNVFPHPDGRTIPGCYGHAVAIESLVRRASVRLPRPSQSFALLLGSAAVGGLLALLVRGRLRRAVVIALLAALTVVSCALMYRHASYLVNPIEPLISLVLAVLLVGQVLRIRAAQPS